MGRQKKYGLAVPIVMVLIVLVSGCATSRLSHVDVAAVQSATRGKSVGEVMDLAETSMGTAVSERLDYYAPLHLAEAHKHLKKAQSLKIKKGGEDAAVILEAESARMMIDKGLVVKEAVLRQLSEVFDMKDRLDQLRADIHARSDYDRQMDHVRKLIEYIEKDDQKSVEKKKKGYLDTMIALEIAVVKKTTLAEAREILDKAREDNARKLAPKTWQTAEDTLKQAIGFIESFPRDEKGVERVGREALRACRHAYFVTREVMVLQTTDKDHFENLVLDFETKLNRITLGLSHDDVRHMSLHDQSVALADAAERLKRNLAALNREKTVPEDAAPLPPAVVAYPLTVDLVSDTVIPPAVTPEPDFAASPPDEKTITPSPAVATPASPTLPLEPFVEPEEDVVESLDPDDLYLSDEERAQRAEDKRKVSAAAFEPVYDAPSAPTPETPEPLDLEMVKPEETKPSLAPEAEAI